MKEIKDNQWASEGKKVWEASSLTAMGLGSFLEK